MNIALMAHDNRKELMVQFCTAYCGILAKHTLCATARTGHVGDHLVPMPHFGAILELPDWHALAARLRAANTAFVLEPQVRFEGQPGEQWTMFFHDPSGNPMEIKGFRTLDGVYAT